MFLRWILSHTVLITRGTREAVTNSQPSASSACSPELTGAYRVTRRRLATAAVAKVTAGSS